MKLFLMLVNLLWLVRIVGNIITYIQLWWVKEYRFDRMLVHLKTRQGSRIFFPPFRLPPKRPKNIVLVILTGTTFILLYFILPFAAIIKLLLLDLLTFSVTGLWVGILQIPTFIYHQMQIQNAVKKIRSHKSLKVIGITGSYGKTSTKEYLATILETKYKVLKTEASKNSPIGIAEVIQQNLKPDHEIFVVEMGAYKGGEIARMVEMVRPSVGIVTAINPQHLDLFGSMEATMEAKYELIAGLPPQGIGIFNGDDEKVRQMAEWAHRENKKAWFYTCSRNKLPKWSEKIISAENIKVGKNDLAFTLKVVDQRFNISANVLGEHQVSNILAAISGTLALSQLSLKEIAYGVRKIKPFTKTMQSIPGINGSIYINDTFNNNPDAAIAALNYLAKTQGKKILVFQPMIELGEYAVASHESVGHLAAQVCDEIFLTNDNFFEDFERGVKSSDPKKEVNVFTPIETAKKIRATIGKDDTVLFKGKQAENVLKLLI